MKKNILFDLYGVLLLTQGDQAMREIEQVVHGDSSIWEAFWKLRGPLDGGRITDQEFWQQFQEETGLRDFDIEEAIRVDYSGWRQADPEMVEFVTGLIEDGWRVGLLSNIPETLARLMLAENPWLQKFHSVTLSCEIKNEKPRPEAFRIALEQLGTEAEETFFFDDNLENVEAARGVGLKAYQFTGIDSVKAVL
ncbi:MAG: HAD family phosphatase [Corynebacterium sp.]|nr:HAD family phosphatase [Corynebacterium sp.]